MKKKSFSKQLPGELVKVKPGSWAFIPNRLPPEIKWDGSFFLPVAQADRALGRLESLLETCPAGLNLKTALIYREMVAVLQLEGKSIDLVTFLKNRVLNNNNSQAEKDAQNILELFENAIDCIAMGMRVDVGSIIDLATKTMKNEELSYRKDEKSSYLLFPENSEKSEYSPPPAAKINVTLYGLDAFIRRPNNLPALLHASLCFYQYMAIYPFPALHRRLSAVLLSASLSSSKAAPYDGFTLSHYLSNNLPTFEKMFFDVIQNGNWQGWITFILEGVRQDARSTEKIVTSLIALNQRYHSAQVEVRSSIVQTEFVNKIFRHPMMTVGDAAQILRVTPRAAQLNIDKLIELGALTELTGKKRNRVYCAKEILDILTEENKEGAA